MKIEVMNVTKKFKDEIVINSTDVCFKAGKIYGLVGKNGCGKSVFLKMLCALYYPTEGKILIDGIDYIKKREFPPNFGVLIEDPAFINELNGFDNLKLLSKIQNKIDDNQILKILELVNLKNINDKKVGKYSLGMKQKLGIAQALMEDPEVILLDEPFNSVDDETTKKLREYLTLLKKQGKLIIIVTHIKEDLENIADEILKFENNKLVKLTNVGEI